MTCNLSGRVEEKGRQDNMIETAKRMLEDGILSLEKIAEYTTLSMEEVLKLKKSKMI